MHGDPCSEAFVLNKLNLLAFTQHTKLTRLKKGWCKG